MNPRHTRRLLKPKRPTYSRLGTVFIISLAVFCFLVVSIKLFDDDSGKSALLYLAMGGFFFLVVAAAFLMPVTPRERAAYTVRKPMDLDLTNFDPTKKGLPW